MPQWMLTEKYVHVLVRARARHFERESWTQMGRTANIIIKYNIHVFASITWTKVD